MTIRTQSRISVLLFALILAVVIASVILTSVDVGKAGKQERTAEDIARGAGELGYLVNDYLIYGEGQQLSRWRSRFTSFSQAVASLRVEQTEQQALLHNIQANQQRLKEVFDSLPPPKDTGGLADPVSFQVSWSRMAVQSQGLTSDASRLSHLLRDEADRSKQINLIVIFAAMGAFGAYFLVGYLMVQQRMLRSVAKLQAGAKVIGSGDLAFVVEEKKNDEIGDLSRAFNRMTADLKAITASRSDLQREMAERERVESALREGEQRWATTLSSIGDAVIATDAGGRVAFVNAVAEGLTGWSSSDAAGRPVTEVFNIVNEQTRQTVESPVVKVLSKGAIVGLANHTMLVRKDGTEVPVDDSGAPIKDPSGRVTGVVLVFRDITERKRVDEELRQSRDKLEQRVTERTEELRTAYERLKQEMSEREQVEKQLRQAQKMEALGTLSGGIAHDFNNILAAIIGFGELIQGHAEKDSRDERHARRILEAALRGRELVKQMLTFSRQTEQEKKPLRISIIVKETEKLLRAMIPTTISIKVNTVSESGLILGDATQIQQVVMNLCTNAAHAMREKGGILDIDLSDFSVSESNGSDVIGPGLYAKLTVRDTGAGIPPEIGDRIFDPFFTTKKVGEGTGLGLSVVQGIVRNSQGHITVESEPGKGSTFTVYFPKMTGEAQPEGARDEAMIPTGTERILFVDDEEALVEMGRDILAELGYEVTSRMSSIEALSLIRQDPNQFDLVVTDQTMPDLTGIDLAREILSFRADMPIIMCTGYSQLVDADKAKAAGIRAFAMKPLTKSEIAKTIRQVLDA